MPGGEATASQSAPAAAPAPARPRCCCEERCTCTHCHGRATQPRSQPARQRGSSRAPGDHQSSASYRVSHVDVGAQAGPHASRRCQGCIPEEALLREAELLTLQQRCGAARLSDQRRRSTLAEAVGSPHDTAAAAGPCYQSNTAELLRRQRNAFYQSAVNAEYAARRRMLQEELAARRDEIADLHRAREAQRMEAARVAAQAAHRAPSRGPSPRRSYSVDPATRARLSTPPPPPPPPRTYEAPNSAAAPAAEARQSATQTGSAGPARAASVERGPRTRAADFAPASWQASYGPYPPYPPQGEWHCGWIWCPAGARGGMQYGRSPSPPRQGSRLPPPPPAQGDAAAQITAPPPAAAAPAKPSAAEIVSMLAAGDVEKSLACLAGDATRGRRSRTQQTRSHSAAAAVGTLAAPRYGRKVFITDDAYCDRRARYLAEWEARGAVRRVPATTRSPSAPLPERTPKWRTTGVEPRGTAE